ncbi:hypothetical protein WICPIJ_006438, partial [Wickerhamomyces pijperi]
FYKDLASLILLLLELNLSKYTVPDQFITILASRHPSGQDLVVNNKIINSETSEDVPPSMALCEDTKWQTKNVTTNVGQLRAQDKIHVPDEKSKDK